MVAEIQELARSKALSLLVNSSSSRRHTPPAELSVDEVQVAEREIFRHLQKLSFPEVVGALQRVSRNQESSRQVKPGLRKLKISRPCASLMPCWMVRESFELEEG